MRKKSEIIKELDRVQSLYNRLSMDIGQGYANIKLKNDDSLVAIVNQKIEAFKQAEVQLRLLEQELENTSE